MWWPCSIYRGTARLFEGAPAVAPKARRMDRCGGQLSSGAAAQLAGVPKPYFLSHLADYGVNAFDLSEEDLIHDLKSA